MHDRAGSMWMQRGWGWGRRSLPLLGSVAFHGVLFAGLSQWEARSVAPMDWQVEAVELTPDELARVPDLDDPSAMPAPAGGWQFPPSPVPDRQALPMPEDSTADRWRLPTSSEESERDDGDGGQDLYRQWRQGYGRELAAARRDQQRRLQEAQRRQRERQAEAKKQAGQPPSTDGETPTDDPREDGPADGPSTGGSTGASPGTTSENGRQAANRQEGSGSAGSRDLQGGSTQGPGEGEPAADERTVGSSSPNSWEIAALPPVGTNSPTADDRDRYSFDGTRVGKQAAEQALTRLLGDSPWGQLYREQPMRDATGKPPEGMQGPWRLVNEDAPLAAVYRTPLVLCSLDPKPATIRLAVAIGPEGRLATGEPPDAFQPQVLSSSGYSALDDYAIAQLKVALQTKQGDKQRLTPADGYGVFVYAISYGVPQQICDSSAPNDTGDPP